MATTNIDYITGAVTVVEEDSTKKSPSETKKDTQENKKKSAKSALELAREKKRQELLDKYGNEAKVYYYLRGVGWTHKGTCGVMGNIKQESDFSTTATSFDGFGSAGICQWTFGRKTNLQNFLKKNNYPLDSLKGQCEFLDYETKTSYPKIYAYLTKSTNYTVVEIAVKFCKEWERPAEWAANYPRRTSSAELYYKRYKDTFSEGDSIGDSDSNSETGTNIDFNKTTEKLISSNNFEYIQTEEKERESSIPNLLKDIKSQLEKANANKTTKESAQQSYEDVKKALSNFEKLLKSQNKKVKDSPRKFSSVGKIEGATLPISNTLVEAPFVEVDLNGVKFGTSNVSKYYTSYPNYIQSISITKTNGTINEYTITLIHQIAPGDNPNYIAELLSSVGYNEITISYGDANYGKFFQDVKAMVTGVQTSFNFTGYNITYTIQASSLSYLTASTKLNFPAVVDKPSNVIMNLIKDKTLLLTDYFTGMSNITQVLRQGLIPTNDKVVNIEAVTNQTITKYLSYLTSLMEDENEQLADKSTYYLSINEDTFSIKEVIADNIKTSELIYEVDVGYPDDNMVFDFNINTNYAWAATYNTANKITNYNYDINGVGDITKFKASNLISVLNSDNTFAIDKNTWKQLTRFPLTATLTVKGLMAPIMLLTYIRINNYYFGGNRITSGLYIVTSQKDTISGNGCRTALGLTRVASDVESLEIDGRIRT